MAAEVKEERQIAAEAEGVLELEEEEAVAAEEIGHVVLGGGDQDVDAGLFQQFVEAGGIEGHGSRPAVFRGRFDRRRRLHAHLGSPSSALVM